MLEKHKSMRMQFKMPVGFLIFLSTLVNVMGYGAVFTQTNAAAGNSLIVFNRNAAGILSQASFVPTGGNGTGNAGLSSSGALALTSDGKFLFVVNAGSGTVSAFSVSQLHYGWGPTNVQLIATASSGGQNPVSVDSYTMPNGDVLVYVLNSGLAGAGGSIMGLVLKIVGYYNFSLTPIAGSNQNLSSPNSTITPVQVSFNLEGTVLIVTEKSSNLIDLFPVSPEGIAGRAVSFPSSGPGPFGFSVYGDYIIVSEVVNAAVSSYTVSRTSSGNVSLVPISVSILDGGAGACWVEVTPNGEWAYAANAHGNTISSFSLDTYGNLALWASTAANTNIGPTDVAISRDGQYLYQRCGGSTDILVFSINSIIGALTLVDVVSNLPSSTFGLLAS